MCRAKPSEDYGLYPEERDDDACDDDDDARDDDEDNSAGGSGGHSGRDRCAGTVSFYRLPCIQDDLPFGTAAA